MIGSRVLTRLTGRGLTLRSTFPLVALIINLLTCALGISQQSFERWAVIADAQLSATGDLVTVALGEIPGLKLVERERLDEVVRELRLNRLLDADAATERLRTGGLLNAHALVLLAIEKNDDKESVQLLVSDCRFGARIAQEYFPLPADGEAIAARACQIVHNLRQQFSSGVTSLIAVPPFRSRDLTYQHMHLQDGLANVLRTALLRAPGLALLELDEVRAIERELVLSSAPSLTATALPVFVEGDFRTEPSAERIGITLTLAVAVDNRRVDTERHFNSVDEAASYLRGEYATDLIRRAGGSGVPMPLKNQVELLSQRADAFTMIGGVYRAVGLREAILLLDPSNAEQTKRLTREYAAAMPYKERVNWDNVKSEDAIKGIQERFGLWRRALDLVARLIGRRQITQAETFALLGRLDKAMSEFGIRHGFRDRNTRYDNPIVEELDREYAETTRVLREFVRGAALVIPELDRGDAAALERPPATDRPVRPGPREASAAELHDRWVQYLLVHSGWTRAEPDSLRPRFSHLVWCLEEPLQNERKPIGITGPFISACTDRDHRDANGLSPEFLEETLARLEQSPSETAQMNGRLCRIFFDRFIGHNKVTLSPEQASQALDAWSSYARGLGYRNEIMIKRYRERLAPGSEPATKPTRAVLASQPAAPQPKAAPASQPTSNPALQLAVEEVKMSVVRLSGERLSLSEWLDQSFGRDETDHVISTDQMDIFWNGFSVRLQREPGVMQEIWFHSRGGHSGIQDVAFDGRDIWAITCCEGVRVWNSAGDEIASLPVGDDLPAAHRGAKLAAIAPGRVLAVGCFGVDKRAWCATLTLGDQTVSTDVFHEATTVFTNPQNLASSMDDPKVVFIPTGLYRLEGSQGPHFLVQRAIASESARGSTLSPAFLDVDPMRRSVAVLDYRLPRYGIANVHPQYGFVGDQCVMVNRKEIGRYSPRGAAVLFSNPREMLEGALYRQGESFLVRGLSWYRLDPQTWTVTELGRWPSDIPKLTGFTWAGVSHHHGVILWNSQGRYYRVLGGRAAEDVAAALTARSTELRKHLATKPKDWDAWRTLVWCLYDGNRAEEAKQACLDWIGQFPTRAEPRFALADIERKRLTGHTLWESPANVNSSFPSLALWFVNNQVQNGPPSMKDAVRLPAAENPEQWLIAEAAYLSIAGYRIKVAHAREAIEVCDRWQREAEQRGAGTDQSYFVIRAAAQLRLGEFDAARVDADHAIEAERARRAWAGGAEALLRAIQATDKEYRYRCDPPVYDLRCWWPGNE